MSQGKFEIEGLDELRKQLLIMPDRVKRNTLLRILRSGSKVVIDQARHELAQKMEKAYSEGRFPTGNLYESIGHITGKSIEYPNIQVGARVKRGFKGYHMHWVSFGTKNRRSRHGFRGRMHGDNFMARSFSVVQSQVSKNLSGAVARYVEKIAKQTIVPKY